MKSLWCAIKSEVVKLRHTPIFLLHIIVPLLGGLRVKGTQEVLLQIYPLQ